MVPAAGCALLVLLAPVAFTLSTVLPAAALLLADVPPVAVRSGSVPVLDPAAAAEAPASWESGVPGVALARGVTLSVAPGRMPALLLLTARPVSPVRMPGEPPVDVPPVADVSLAEFETAPEPVEPPVPLVPLALPELFAVPVLLEPPLTVPP
jgi:hypothetical protein